MKKKDFYFTLIVILEIGVIQLVELRELEARRGHSFARVSSQVTRLDIRRTAYCERPFLFNHPG
jgi:hypothetical protein